MGYVVASAETSGLLGRTARQRSSLVDAISIDPRDAAKRVVAKSLLTLAASLTDQNLNRCRKRDSNSRPHHYELDKSNVPHCPGLT
jgi:hypothetical protein